MATKERIEQLQKLVAQVGGVRKAESAINSVKHCAPSKSSIDRAIKANNSVSDYIVQTYIDDLNVYLQR